MTIIVLGRRDNPTVLHVQFPQGGSSCGLVVAAGPGRVFEDIAPRLADLDGDGENEVIVVRSDVKRGAQLAIYGMTGQRFGLIASTPFIGMPHRWLAPAGIADFDGDGRLEIAYVDRPHLTRELVVVRLEGQRLREIARSGGFTAHRIGDAGISSAVRVCADGRAELLVPDAGWSRLMAVRLEKGRLAARDLGRDVGQGAVRRCRCRLRLIAPSSPCGWA